MISICFTKKGEETDGHAKHGFHKTLIVGDTKKKNIRAIPHLFKFWQVIVIH